MQQINREQAHSCSRSCLIFTADSPLTRFSLRVSERHHPPDTALRVFRTPWNDSCHFPS